MEAGNIAKLLWCTKLQFLKDIHNQPLHLGLMFLVVMMYKVTIFERYTQQWFNLRVHVSVVMMYKVTIFERYTQLYCGVSIKSPVVMMYKVTIFERYTQLNNKKEKKGLFFLHIYKKIYTFAVQFWKIYTIRIIPLCKHSEWHAGVALFLYYPTRYIPSVNAIQKTYSLKKMRARMHFLSSKVVKYNKKSLPLQRNRN